MKLRQIEVDKIYIEKKIPFSRPFNSGSLGFDKGAPLEEIVIVVGLHLFLLRLFEQRLLRFFLAG